jgi:hypothetical protein
MSEKTTTAEARHALPANESLRSVTFERAEWRLLLECCAPERRGEVLAALLRAPLDWNLVNLLAQEHGVTAHVAARLASDSAALMPANIVANMRERCRQQRLFALAMSAELFRLLEAFTAAGIETTTVKGPVLSMQAYGDAGVREYIDLDLLVRHSDVSDATRIMTAGGYESDVPLGAIEAGKTPGEYLFIRPDTRLLAELHTEKTLRYFPRPAPLEEFFARKIQVPLDGREVPALCPEDELILISIHAAKHLWERLMWIADVAALVERQTQLDWERATASARATGAERMLHVALLLAMRLLGAKIPASVLGVAQRDAAGMRLVAHIERRLPSAGTVAPSLAGRAAFRMRMRGGMLPGAAYLLRLSLSPTEDDWAEENASPWNWLWDAARRPFRLARKYRGGA